MLVILCLLFAGETQMEYTPGVAQVVALDECDPATFHSPTAVRPDFCRNVALGASTTFADLFAAAQSGNPDSKWDFEPDSLTINKGTILSVVIRAASLIPSPKSESSEVAL